MSKRVIITFEFYCFSTFRIMFWADDRLAESKNNFLGGKLVERGSHATFDESFIFYNHLYMYIIIQ